MLAFYCNTAVVFGQIDYGKMLDPGLIFVKSAVYLVLFCCGVKQHQGDILPSIRGVVNESRSSALDSAVAEQFFQNQKTECLVNWRDVSVDEVKRDILDYIEMFYNNERLHCFAGYYSPGAYEKLMAIS
jgi:transposase InsO family protein